MNAFFFAIFGFGKTAVLTHLIVVHSIVIVVTFLIARKYTSVPVAVLTALLTTTSFYWPISHPWYDQSAHLWGILAIGSIALGLPFENKRNAFKIGVFCGVMAILSFMAKTNVGIGYGLLLLLALFVSPKKIKTTGGYFIGALIAAVVMLIVIRDPAKYLEQAFFTFDIPVQKLRRFLPLLWIPTWLADYYWVFAAVVLLNVKSHWKECQPFVTLHLGTFVLTILCASTGSMKPSANIPLI